MLVLVLVFVFVLCFALLCLAVPCRALLCLALPCVALPCLVLRCLALRCLALPVVEPRTSPPSGDAFFFWEFTIQINNFEVADLHMLIHASVRTQENNFGSK